MKSTIPLLATLATLALLPFALADEAGEAEKKAKPLRVLMLTGGCCHDYKAQKEVLSAGIGQRANVEFTVVQEDGPGRNTTHQFDLLKKDDWEKDFDAVLYNICFADEKDVSYITSITETHKKGLPAVALHCTYHSHHWRTETDSWEEFLGVTSPGHGPKAPIKMVPTEEGKTHPVMVGFPAEWTTPKGELYRVKQVWPSATVLAMGDNGRNNQACVWVNKFGDTRVFGTSVGHHTETMAENVYLDMVSRGLLWVSGNLNEDGTPAAGMGGE